VTQVLHNLIDSKADQSVINERVAGLLEADKKDLHALEVLVATITSDHEKRVRYLERIASWALGAVGAISAVTGLTVTLLKVFTK
jgi:hypothetical protein